MKINTANSTARTNKTAILLPSVLSGVAVALITVIAVGLSYLLAQNTVSPFGEELFAVKGVADQSVGQVADRFAQNNFVSNLPLLLFYAAVGTLVYAIAVYIYGLFGKVAAIEASTNYIHADQRTIVTNAITVLILRIVTIVAWFGYAILFVKQLLPYFLSTVHVAGLLSSPGSFVGLLTASLALALSLHVHVVFSRLLVQKTRLF